MEIIQNEDRKVSPKDVFLHLLAIVTLYASAIALLMLAFDYINVYFPDVLSGGYNYYSAQGARQSIRWELSMLVVVFPVYIIVSWFLNKGYEANPPKRNLRIRKWLVYFTLFAAALIVMGDFVGLIYNLLGGELTVRFFLKALSVFLVAGSVFFYYFSDLRRHRVE